MESDIGEKITRWGENTAKTGVIIAVIASVVVIFTGEFAAMLITWASSAAFALMMYGISLMLRGFGRIIEDLDELTLSTKKINHAQKIQTEKQTENKIENKSGTVVTVKCPHCGSAVLVDKSVLDSNRAIICNNCKKIFTSQTCE